MDYDNVAVSSQGVIYHPIGESRIQEKRKRFSKQIEMASGNLSIILEAETFQGKV